MGVLIVRWLLSPSRILLLLLLLLGGWSVRQTLVRARGGVASGESDCGGLDREECPAPGANGEMPLRDSAPQQLAAVRGIQAWQGHPFPLSVRTRRRGDPADITVQWVDSLGDNRIGRARIEWIREGAEVQIKVLGLDLATGNPSDPTRVLTPRQIQLVAAHEMGHALGLPHSDDHRDVMCPLNSAHSLSVRDYRTMEALYALPNGAEIRR